MESIQTETRKTAEEEGRPDQKKALERSSWGAAPRTSSSTAPSPRATLRLDLLPCPTHRHRSLIRGAASVIDATTVPLVHRVTRRPKPNSRPRICPYHRDLGHDSHDDLFRKITDIACTRYIVCASSSILKKCSAVTKDEVMFGEMSVIIDQLLLDNHPTPPSNLLLRAPKQIFRHPTYKTEPAAEPTRPYSPPPEARASRRRDTRSQRLVVRDFNLSPRRQRLYSPHHSRRVAGSGGPNLVGQ
ncbi:hypothetical protein QBC47DRAFT_34730 [Echria macrotheca]|uniref:Uncharacterized protein n=1 Tax=Echria macrotheca TaxID=438768 RepID=A0AAJ0F410_9PEZI|nr:hypothetical protein QBC47DRAFT_34730 [Echria macrotheca]